MNKNNLMTMAEAAALLGDGVRAEYLADLCASQGIPTEQGRIRRSRVLWLKAKMNSAMSA